MRTSVIVPEFAFVQVAAGGSNHPRGASPVGSWLAQLSTGESSHVPGPDHLRARHVALLLTYDVHRMGCWTMIYQSRPAGAFAGKRRLRCLP